MLYISHIPALFTYIYILSQLFQYFKDIFGLQNVKLPRPTHKYFGLKICKKLLIKENTNKHITIQLKFRSACHQKSKQDRNKFSFSLYVCIKC